MATAYAIVLFIRSVYRLVQVKPNSRKGIKLGAAFIVFSHESISSQKIGTASPSRGVLSADMAC